jgi:hypothetical protein
MFIIHGKQTARIKKHTDNHQVCQSCKSLDLDVKVYRDYYHLFFIPIFPVGIKSVEIKCKNCGEPMRLETVKKHYEGITKTPFYLFTWLILFAGLCIVLLYANLNNQREKAKLVGDPKVGDVYTIKKDEHDSITYYFLLLVRVNDNLVVAYHSNLEYYRFVSRLHEDDYFVKGDELFLTKNELKQMLERGEINSVSREYGTYKGFHRAK